MNKANGTDGICTLARGLIKPFVTSPQDHSGASLCVNPLTCLAAQSCAGSSGDRLFRVPVAHPPASIRAATAHALGERGEGEGEGRPGWSPPSTQGLVETSRAGFHEVGLGGRVVRLGLGALRAGHAHAVSREGVAPDKRRVARLGAVRAGGVVAAGTAERQRRWISYIVKRASRRPLVPHIQRVCADQREHGSRSGRRASVCA